MFRRQAEHAFGHDVAQDLRRSALDRVALCPQIPVSGSASGEVDGLRAAQRPVVVAQSFVAGQLEFESRDRLCLTGKSQLHRGALGARLARRELLAKAFSGETGDLCVDPQLHHPIQRRGLTVVRILAPPLRELADHPTLARSTGADGNPLVVESRCGNTPSVADVADAVGVGHTDVGEENLVELRFTGDLPQWPDLDTRCTHVDDEVREPGVFDGAGIGARHQDCALGVVRARCPHLLTVDHPRVAVANRTRCHACEVRPRSRFAEQLAVDVFTGVERTQETGALFLGAECSDRRCRHSQSDSVATARGPRSTGRVERGVDARLIGLRNSESTVPDREVHPGQSGIETGTEEIAFGRLGRRVGGEQPGHARVEVGGDVVGYRRWSIREHWASILSGRGGIQRRGACRQSFGPPAT